MALKPLLKSKVDELFARWLSDPETQLHLKENLRQLCHGESITQQHLTSPRSTSKQSPRLRPSSPPYSPNSTKLPNPRSPRRPLSNKNKSNNGTTRINLPNSAKDITKKESPTHDHTNSSIQSSTSPGEQDKENKHLSIVTASPTVKTLQSGKESEKGKKRENTVQLHNKLKIPKFYHPYGKPVINQNKEDFLQGALHEIGQLEDEKAFKQHMKTITKACNLPLYWKSLLFHASGGDEQGYITKDSFTSMWQRVFLPCHDEAAQFVKLAAKENCNCLDEEDFFIFVQDVVDTHPGLTFLQEAPEFHSRYINTVIARIFYSINRSWSGKVTISELRKSNFLQTISLLEQEDDINQITDFFSYEHFYVIYCKFWELDKDHDLYISKEDLARHNDHAVSLKVIDRIFSGSVIKSSSLKDGRMGYPDFVWFLMSEEDKKHPTSIEYWFRCMDLDGDGVISMYEMEYFYDEQMQKMESLGIEKLPFEDCLCQMLDLVRPKVSSKITLTDLKNCKMANIFFDTFFNLDKFLDHEQRDPFANARDFDSDSEPSDWEKYAAEEYEILVAEEGSNDQEEVHYEDDFEPDDEELINQELKRVQQSNSAKYLGGNDSNGRDNDIYDFSTDNMGY
ncbi:serine/threonine-protein phosphatase 2A regulatory subunit B'' subunit beta-like isoform X2 [Ostrea edulis]|uniref:serine/threonine-protein phosphatase 2A regulatory subunit B'' subunit beta-like isoform X2 n=1 Tax=Ostrea edulis TaxID=37623 RepID=UPI0020965E81|nr:serine/threonine-protein phosphatase 2A regulatory subunit B'' subunit beta-like isoform X2 [Ostrea edulis]XP_048745431.1 serine/threonine-protein phosphatase 2A regulatory subunit B'' subunit beta-like isoform X2 [Ostrea edulis]